MDPPDPIGSSSNADERAPSETVDDNSTQQTSNPNQEGSEVVPEPNSVANKETDEEVLPDGAEPMEVGQVVEPETVGDVNVPSKNSDGDHSATVQQAPEPEKEGSENDIEMVGSELQQETNEDPSKSIERPETVEDMEVVVEKENLDSVDKKAKENLEEEPDNPEFVSAENEDKNETVVEETESDPIAGEDDKNEMEMEECILPDEEETELMEEPGEQYIVTKISGVGPKECMECEKTEVPKYSCKVTERSLYICDENCLKVLKEKKAGQIIIRDLRVKTFAVVDSPEAPSTAEDNENVCTLCKKPISSILYFNCNCMNFCSYGCLGNYQKELGSKCFQCSSNVPEPLLGKYCVRFGTDIKQFCKNACLWEHKRGQRFCLVCQAVVPTSDFPGYCSLTCNNVSKNIRERAICAVCKFQKVQKMTYEDGNHIYRFCGEPCFLAYKYVNNICPVQCEFCKKSMNVENLPYRFWFLDKKCQLCSEECKKLLITTTRKIVHCKTCNVKKYDFDMISIMNSGEHFTVCSLNCYDMKLKAASTTKESNCDFCEKNCHPQFHIRTLDNVVHNFCSAVCLKQFKDNLNKSGETPLRKVKQIVVVKPHLVPPQRNVATMCKPNMVTKAISCRTKEATKGCQTDPCSNKFIVPIPVPIYVPTPLGMYSLPVPCPFPFPIPIPVPIFIPTTRNSIKGIQKEINRIRNKTPSNPLEAELLMMAEMVAEDKQDPTDTESEGEVPAVHKTESIHEEEEEEVVDQPSFGEDVIQMALKMATDFDESEELEGGIPAAQNEDDTQRIEAIMETKRRNIRQGRGKRKTSYTAEVDKPDANMCLKYTFGVNAWKQWVAIKNIEMQKSSKKCKLFKSEILHTTADELNYCLCLFVNEVRKPNGSDYAPDTIYYLCLGIQQYLYENGRIDNIFCDSFYEKFTDCLQEVCQKFSVLYNESQYIVTRVEEEHLWECKQLGAHSPLVLLNTLMFFNTKHFGLTTVEEHLQLSFSHIMKHWKRNPSQPGSRSVLLRFYPPQNADKPRKKRVYEQQENEQNPIRCPVKLYEFYLSKCPESVKMRNDVFYLQPERSCVPDSPVWYSTMALDKDPLEKMLGRVKMVKEINVAILTS